MTYERYSDPADTAALFRSFRTAPTKAARDALVKCAPLPVGSSICFRVDKSETLDQDRLNLPKGHAASMDKVRGIVAAIKDASSSANTHTPACLQVLPKISWWGREESRNRSVFVRTNAYSAGFTPRVITCHPHNVARGDIIFGLIHRLFSKLILTQG